MSTRSLDDARQWLQDGTSVFVREADLDATVLEEPSGLPGWSRHHLIAHVTANAEALGNLVHWAATGDPTPMYASAEAREAGIEEAALVPGPELAAWLRRSAAELEQAMNGLTEEQWQAQVKTAQGRMVPATEVPWMRAREVWVHGIDLATGLSFGDLPAGLVAALCDEATDTRGTGPGPKLVLTATDTGGSWEIPGDGDLVRLAGPLAEIAAYLTGRPHRLGTTEGDPAPDLPAWL